MGEHEQQEPKIGSKWKRNAEQYMTDRVQFKINLYYRKAKMYRFWYLFISVVVCIGAAVVPVFINMGRENRLFLVIASILSLLVSIGVGLQEIFRFREHWRNYSLVDSNLRNEEMLYSTSAGKYKLVKNDEEEKLNLFVENIEELIKDERIDTINMRTAANRIMENEKMVASVVEDYIKNKVNNKTVNPETAT